MPASLKLPKLTNEIAWAGFPRRPCMVPTLVTLEQVWTSIQTRVRWLAVRDSFRVPVTCITRPMSGSITSRGA